MDDDTHVILQQLKTLQNSVDRIDEDLAHDRENMQQFQIRLGSLENQVKLVVEQLNNLPRQVSHEVSDALEPAVNEVNDMKEIIAKTKAIAFETPVHIRIKRRMKKLFRKAG